jgi:hypothetical protein
VEYSLESVALASRVTCSPLRKGTFQNVFEPLSTLLQALLSKEGDE